MNTWLVLDVNYLCHRAHHALGDLSHGGQPTEVIYGCLRDIGVLQKDFQATRLIFCFDFGKGIRERMSPAYKHTRREKYANAPPTEKHEREQFVKQVQLLRAKVLAACGYANIFYADGYESDDVMASVCLHTVPPDEDAIIVTADKDLWQCIGPRRTVYNPATHKVLNLTAFERDWGLSPSKWPMVKAIAGCGTDDVEGVDGVGEKTAAQFLRGELKTTYKTYKAIMANKERIKFNLPLVTLPLPNCPVWQYTPDDVTAEKWAAVADRLGLKSLRDDPPMPGVGTPKGFGFHA